MGSCYSILHREEMVSRCKARKRYMKQFVRARRALSVSIGVYLRSLRSSGAALVLFAAGETNVDGNIQPSPLIYSCLPPEQPPANMQSTVLEPPPPAASASSWDFWDPFVKSSNEKVGVTVSEVNAPLPTVDSRISEDSETEHVLDSTKFKGLIEIVKELDEYFVKASDAGEQLLLLLETPSDQNSGKGYNCGRRLSPLTWTCALDTKLSRLDFVGHGTESHCSTVERLYAWEKQLYHEVKNLRVLKNDHENKTTQLQKLEARRVDNVKIEKTKKEVEKLDSQIMVVSKAIETTSAEIVEMRESQLYPQLLELVKGSMHMWRNMSESHQAQTRLVGQLKDVNIIPSTEPTSDKQTQSTLQLELEVQQWRLSFCSLIKSQQEYIQSLSGWLRLSLFQFSKTAVKTAQDPKIYSLCEEWHRAVDKIPHKVASEGINSFLTVIHGIVVQQAEERKQKKKFEGAVKELEKKLTELRSLKAKNGGHHSLPEKSNPITDKQAKVVSLKAKAEEEKGKHEKLVSVTRKMTISNLCTGFQNVFQAAESFSNACTESFESVYNSAKSIDKP